MVLNLKLQKNVPTLVEIFSTDGKLQTQLKVQQARISIDLDFLAKGTYLLALSNAFVRYTTKLQVPK
jgi:hypothetical protein